MTPPRQTTTTFRPGLDLRPALQTVRSHAAAFIEQAMTAASLDELRIHTNALRFEPMAAHEGRARQEGEIHVIHGSGDRYPPIQRLHDRLVELVHTHGREIPGCADWHPNEISIQRYHPGALGITRHLDLKRYHYLVAIITAHGTAAFTICKNRDGDPLTTWPAAAGSLILLRGPGLDGIHDGRPLHTVSGPPTDHRVSVSFRMDTTAAPRPRITSSIPDPLA
jgi:hypothetical protein